MGKETFPFVNKKGKVEVGEVEDFQIAFSDEVIKRELDRFIHGVADRFRVIEVPLKGKKEKATMRFNGYTGITKIGRASCRERV